MIKRIPTNSDTPTMAIKVSGDLDLRGWEQQEVEAGGVREENFRASPGGETISIDANSDCDLYVPAGAILDIERIGGDAKITGLAGTVSVRKVGGDLELRQVGQTRIDHIGGDLDADGIARELSAGRVGGDLAGGNIAGTLHVDSVGGDTNLLGCQSAVEIHAIGGDLNLEQATSVRIDAVHGDANLDHIQENVTIHRVNGDFTARDIQGELVLDGVGGDLSVAGAGRSVRASAGGDARLIFTQTPGEDSRVQVGADLLCQIPPDSNLDIEIAAGSGRITLDLPGQPGILQTTAYRLVLGTSGTHLILRAGGDVLITTQSPDWSTHRAFTTDYAREFEDFGKDFARDFEDLGKQIGRVVKHRMHGARRSAHAAERAEAAARQVNERMDAAMQRLQRRGIHIYGPGVTVGSQAGRPTTPSEPVQEPSSPDQPRTEPDAGPEPVTDEERLIILRMLQEKKITLEQAEQLLEALDQQ